jgi:hypothetical protein
MLLNSFSQGIHLYIPLESGVGVGNAVTLLYRFINLSDFNLGGGTGFDIAINALVRFNRYLRVCGF